MLDLYCDKLSDLRNRLKSDNPWIKDAAEREYERCARSPNFTAALLGHRDTALWCLRHSAGLNAWEIGFVSNMLHAVNPSQRQWQTLATLFVKAGKPAKPNSPNKPKRGAFRGRRGGR